MVQLLKKILLNIMVALIGSVIGLIVIECILRFRQLVKYGTMEMFASVKFEIDHHSGLKIPVAGAKTKSITINSQGFRGPELEDPKPRSKLRLAFLGASTTFCSEVSSDGMAWPHLVWKTLQEMHPDVSMDYVNASVPGYTVSSSFRNLIYRVEPLQPDVIIIYHAHNDLVANSRKIAQQQGLYEEQNNMFLFLENFLVWKYFYTNLNIELVKRNTRNDVNRLVFDLNEISRDFRKDLTNLVEYSESISAIVAMATFTYKIRREQHSDDKLMASLISLQNMPYMSIDGLLDGYEEYNRVIREISRERELILIDDELSIPANDDTFNDSIHFNDLGSQLMAERIVQGLNTSEVFKDLLRSYSSP